MRIDRRVAVACLLFAMALVSAATAERPRRTAGHGADAAASVRSECRGDDAALCDGPGTGLLRPSGRASSRLSPSGRSGGPASAHRARSDATSSAGAGPSPAGAVRGRTALYDLLRVYRI